MVKTRATPVGDGWEITGEKWYVPGASDAATLLVIARTIGGPSLYAVERSAPGVTVEPLDGLDEAHQLSRITFEAAPGRLIGRDGAGGRIMNRTVDKAGTVLAGEQMGLVDRALGDYSQVPPSCDDDAAWRRYTRLIAGLEVACCTATALWYRAVTLQGDDDLDAASVAAAIAHIGCSRAVRRVALLLGSAASGIDGEVVAGLRNRARPPTCSSADRRWRMNGCWSVLASEATTLPAVPAEPVGKRRAGASGDADRGSDRRRRTAGHPVRRARRATMRRLSKELGRSQMAAYSYVADKQELLDLVARKTPDVAIPTADSGPWRCGCAS